MPVCSKKASHVKVFYEPHVNMLISKVLQPKALFLQNFSVFAKFFTYTCGRSYPRKSKTPARSPVAVFVLGYTLCIISQKRKNSAAEGESPAKASGKGYEKAIPGICRICMYLTMSQIGAFGFKAFTM